MKLSIGKLRDKVDILQKSLVRKSGGGQTETWTIEDSFWAMVKPKSDFYRLSQNNKLNGITHEIFIRYTTILSPKKKIRLGTRFFDINSYSELYERERFLKINVVESTNATVTIGG